MLGIFQKGFSRGDHKEPDRRCPIAAKIIAGMLETAGANQVIKGHVGDSRSKSGNTRTCGPVLLATAAKLGIGQERGTRDKPSQ